MKIRSLTQISLLPRTYELKDCYWAYVCKFFFANQQTILPALFLIIFKQETWENIERAIQLYLPNKKSLCYSSQFHSLLTSTHWVLVIYVCHSFFLLFIPKDKLINYTKCTLESIKSLVFRFHIQFITFKLHLHILQKPRKKSSKTSNLWFSMTFLSQKSDESI